MTCSWTAAALLACSLMRANCAADLLGGAAELTAEAAVGCGALGATERTTGLTAAWGAVAAAGRVTEADAALCFSAVDVGRAGSDRASPSSSSSSSSDEDSCLRFARVFGGGFAGGVGLDMKNCIGDGRHDARGPTIVLLARILLQL